MPSIPGGTSHALPSPMFSAAWSCAQPARLAIHISIAHHPFGTFFNMTLIDGSTILDLQNSGELLEHNIPTQPHSTQSLSNRGLIMQPPSPHAALQSSHLVTCIQLIMATLQPHFLNSRIICSAVADAKHRRLLRLLAKAGTRTAILVQAHCLPVDRRCQLPVRRWRGWRQPCLRANSLLVRFFFATSRGQHPALRPCVEMVACFAWR